MIWAKNILCAYAMLTMVSIPVSAAPAEACQIRISPSHEIQGDTFSLADLLQRDTCPSLLRATENVYLGKVPRNGVTRVLDGTEVRQRLQTVDMNQVNFRIQSLQVPERILVTRGANERSCADLAEELLSISRMKSLQRPVDCGLGAVHENTRLEIVKKTWDPSSRAWEFAVRCAAARDCVPFLVRVPAEDQHDEVVPLVERHPFIGPSVHVGQKTEVLWDDNGLRLVLRGTALDAGSNGDSIRVRLKAGRVVYANITSSGVVLSH